jgi:threonine dehydrogenase-like Zn-dependent dehydrogenase
MRKVAILGDRQAGFVEASVPTPKENWAVVKVTITPMCTEYKAFLSGARNEFLGHEALGVVDAVAQPGNVKVGDRVVVMPFYPCGQCALCVAGDYIYCEQPVSLKAFLGTTEGSATYAQYLIKPDWLLPRIPDDVSDEQAAIYCCGVGPSLEAFEAMNVNAFDTVLITGAGPVGLGAVINAKFRGARVIVVESNPYRVAYAQRLGADCVLDPRDPDALAQVRSLTAGWGVDKALDCSGVVAAERFCVDATRRRGQVTFVGECNQELTLKVSPDMLRKGLTLRGSWHYNLNTTAKVWQVIRQSPVAKELVSHTFPMSQAQQALELCASGQCAKVLLRTQE